MQFAKKRDCFGNNKRLQRNIVIPDDLTLRIAVVASGIVMYEILEFFRGNGAENGEIFAKDEPGYLTNTFLTRSC